jgi:hypothetical protein
MSKGKFEQELSALLADHEVQPPDGLWSTVSGKLNRAKYLLSGVAILLAGLLSLGFWLQPKSDNNLIAAENAFPDRIILMIDTSYCIDGSVRLDTVYQDLTPKPITDTLSKAGPVAIKEIDESWVIFDLDNPMYVDSTSYNNGKELFGRYCATCHAVEKDMNLTAPSLVGVTARHEKQWLYDFTRNSQKMIQERDPQAIAIREECQPAVINNNLEIEDSELHDIYYYVASWATGD